jgi:hypothetical protein
MGYYTPQRRDRKRNDDLSEQRRAACGAGAAKLTPDVYAGHGPETFELIPHTSDFRIWSKFFQKALI